MHKLYEYICEELKDLEKKASNGDLTMQEVEYGDMLAHFKKNLLTADAMDEGELTGGYSERYYPYVYEGSMNRGGSYRNGSRGSYRGGSYARRRDSMGRYSRDDGMIEDLRAMMEDAPDERTRQKLQRMISDMENNM